MKYDTIKIIINIYRSNNHKNINLGRLKGNVKESGSKEWRGKNWLHSLWLFAPNTSPSFVFPILAHLPPFLYSQTSTEKKIKTFCLLLIAQCAGIIGLLLKSLGH